MQRLHRADSQTDLTLGTSHTTESPDYLDCFIAFFGYEDEVVILDIKWRMHACWT